jgi:ABC-type nitrate/sulfonate/bicarbonate transport system permease component
MAVLAALTLWELSARALEGSYLLAGPVDVLREIVDNAALLARALTATLQSAALGYLWGNLAAIALAVIALLFPLSERPIRILSLIVFCLPLIATGPILRVLYGPGIGPQVTLSALSVFYTTLVPLLAGLRAAPLVWLELVDSYGRGRWTALREVRAMASVPYLVAGLQIAAPAAFLGALIGEFTGAERGLGVLTLRAMRSLDADATWAIATIAAVVSTVAYALAGQLGRWLWPGAPPVLIVPPPAASQRRGLSGHGTTLALFLAIFLLWQGIMDAFGLNRFFAKRPADVWTFLVTDQNAGDHRATLLGALNETVLTAGAGYLAGLATGAIMAALCMLLPRITGAVLPIAVTLRAVPIVITAPLIVLWLGRGATGVVTIVAVMIFFPTLIACLHGLRLVPRSVLDVFDSYAAGRWQILMHARVPAALPAFFASARMAVPAAVLSATVAEWLATGKGVGNLMALSASTSDYNMLWSIIAVLTGIAVIGHALVALAEKSVYARYAPEQLRT